MDMRISPWHRPDLAAWTGQGPRRQRRYGLALFVVLSAWLSWSWFPAPDETGALPAVNQLVHWRDAAHDWLLVIDPATRELVVYDANDGRPLRRLGAADGLPPVRRIAQLGPWLFVTGGPHSGGKLLRLPQLQPVTMAGR
jgi:hypothetical protein